MNINIDLSQVETIATAAFQQTCQALDQEMRNVITETGAFDYLPDRDIVDTGTLRDAQQYTFPTPTDALWTWDTDHSIYPYYGFTLRNGGTFPGRAWDQLAMQRMGIEGYFARQVEERL